MTNADIQNDLQRVREWADDKLATGAEPPWAWFQYMKLREVVDQLLCGMAATRTENLPQSEQRPETSLRLAVSNNRQDIAQPHRPVVETQLPT